MNRRINKKTAGTAQEAVEGKQKEFEWMTL